MTRSTAILRGGLLTTVQDGGRPGHAHLAVPPSGALDQPSYRLANRLVGNPDGAAVLETTLNGVTLRPSAPCHLAVTGAHSPIHVDDAAAGWAVPFAVRPGQTVDVGPATRGLRCYVAISGGIDIPPVLGSRSTDLLSGLGPPVIGTGTVLPLGRTVNPPAEIDYAPYPTPPAELALNFYLGPRDDWLAPAALDLLATATYTVTAHSNRIGLRLQGPPLQRRGKQELPSEGVVLGSVQVPPNGQPILFLADHPTTGGYPIVGVVPTPDVWTCAQAIPGTPIRFIPRRPRLNTAAP